MSRGKINTTISVFSKTLRLISVLLLVLSVFLTNFSNYHIDKVYAANVLTNPSFTGGTTGWTLSSMTYDSTTYQDSAGSVRTSALRKESVTGTATHTSYTSINSTDIVNLSGYWAITITGNGSATLYVEMENQSNPGIWTTIWNTSLQSTTSSWTALNADVSSYFGTGSYRIRLKAVLDGGAAVGSTVDVWFDNMNLDVVTPTVTVGTTGTQTASVSASTSDFYVGGAFTYVMNTSSTTVTGITVSHTGTIADADITGLILYYKQEATCSTSIPVDATQFNATPGTFTSGSSTVTGSMSVGTSQICMYVEVDIGSGASVDETIEIEITNPSSDIAVSSGAVSPATALAISGTTTIVAAVSISISTDGIVSFGHQDVNTTVDTTATGLNDVETVSIISGPADLDVRATTFTDGVNNWSFQSSSGADQIKFDFSKDGTNWTNILLADTLYSLDTNVAQGDSRNLYLRLTTPTSTTSYDQYSSTITIVASTP